MCHNISNQYYCINTLLKKDTDKQNIDFLSKYHITNIGTNGYDIDIVKKEISLLQDDCLIKYYKIDLNKLDDYLNIIMIVQVKL